MATQVTSFQATTPPSLTTHNPGRKEDLRATCRVGRELNERVCARHPHPCSQEIRLSRSSSRPLGLLGISTLSLQRPWHRGRPRIRLLPLHDSSTFLIHVHILPYLCRGRALCLECPSLSFLTLKYIALLPSLPASLPFPSIPLLAPISLLEWVSPCGPGTEHSETALASDVVTRDPPFRHPHSALPFPLLPTPSPRFLLPTPRFPFLPGVCRGLPPEPRASATSLPWISCP